MKGIKQQSFRRNALKQIAAASVWTAPVVHSIVIPAHAQTSPSPTPEEPGTALLHISAILSNPVGGDCTDSSAREIVSISNAGDAPADLSGHQINRVTFAGAETLVSLSGTISPGQTIEYDVCQGTSAGGASARLNNTLGGIVTFTNGADFVDIVQYPPIPNGPQEGTEVTYGPTPSTDVPPRTG